MSLTVSAAFTQFRSSCVDLETERVTRARASRDYLYGQIRIIEDKDRSFPRLYGSYKSYGSFARSTKVRPLDDIDLLVLLNGKGTQAFQVTGYTYGVRCTDTASPLLPYANQDGTVNSTRLLNKFKSSLANVPTYARSEIKRNGVAVVLNLVSYDWAFDIVPSFPISDGQGGTAYYLIPDGAGTWMRTDPRKDSELVTAVNKQHDGLALPVIRLIKYWNRERRLVPTLRSYHLETMLLEGLRYRTSIGSIQVGVTAAFSILASAVQLSCPDPKGLGPALDGYLDYSTRLKVSQEASRMSTLANWANTLEYFHDQKGAIETWQTVFPNFPAYG